MQSARKCQIIVFLHPMWFIVISSQLVPLWIHEVQTSLHAVSNCRPPPQSGTHLSTLRAST